VSYSFGVLASTKAEAETKIRDELVKVCETQPVHKVDCDQAFETAASFLKLLPDDPSRDISASVTGSIWQTERGVEQASVNVNVAMTSRSG